MTSKDVRNFLKEHLVPAKLYKVGGEKKGRICLEKTGDGWEVFYRDKKDRVGAIYYQDEESACRGMLSEIRKFMECAYGVTWVAA